MRAVYIFTIIIILQNFLYHYIRLMKPNVILIAWSHEFCFGGFEPAGKDHSAFCARLIKS